MNDSVSRRAILALAAALPLTHIHAQEKFPNHTVTVVVPYAPGGNTDVLARTLAQGLAAQWSEAVVVDNKAGAGTNIGAQFVARAPSDGYTLFIGQSASHGINLTLYRKLPFDPIKDFTPIALLAESTLFLVVQASGPHRSVSDLVAASKAGTRLNYGSVGVGSAHHLAGQLLKTQLGLDAEHIPYKGSALMLQALYTGEIQFAFDATALTWVRDGRLRALAVARTERWPLAAEIPSLTEQGVPDFQVGGWFALLAPAGLPASVVDRIAGDVAIVKDSAEFKARLVQLGLAPLAGGPKATGTHIEREIGKYAQLVRAAGATAD